MKSLILLCVIGLALFLPAHASACTIPVFRYALEKWELTPYEILVYHRGPLPAELDKTLKAWIEAPNKANIDISVLNLDGEIDVRLLKLWQREGRDADTPWMLVRYKEAGAGDPSAWAGPCSVAHLNSVFDSPLRRTILAHLTRGASSVYVLLTSDDAEKDRAAHAFLHEKLQTLEKKIKLPEQSKEGPQMKLPVALKVALPLLVLDRNKPDEAAFVKLLLATEDGLDAVKGPIVFPIFGRGRVLCGLHGKDIEENLLFATEFLCRACSCEVKRLNPGVDMLMVAHWNEIFDRMFDGKDGLPMPTETFTWLPLRDLPTARRQMAPTAVGASVIAFVPASSAAPAKRVALATLESVLHTGSASAASIPALSIPQAPAAPTPSVGEESPACCSDECPLVRNWRWIAIGGASLLVVGTGVWSVCAWRKSH